MERRPIRAKEAYDPKTGSDGIFTSHAMRAILLGIKVILNQSQDYERAKIISNMLSFRTTKPCYFANGECAKYVRSPCMINES